MIVISDDLKEKLLNNHVSNIIEITVWDGLEQIKTFRNDRIVSESLELTQSICDEKELKFGGCISSQFKIKLLDIADSIVNKQIRVVVRSRFYENNSYLHPDTTVIPSRNLRPGMQRNYSEKQFDIFRGVVFSDKRTKNRRIRQIVAYDDLYAVNEMNVYTFFENFARYSPNATLGAFRESLLNSVGIEDKDDTAFVGVNDNKMLSLSLNYVKSKYSSKITFYDLFRSYCELNGVFAILDGKGKIKYVSLRYPRPRDDITSYKSLDFEEYKTAVFNGVEIAGHNEYKFLYQTYHNRDYEISWYLVDNNAIMLCWDITKHSVLEIADSFAEMVIGNFSAPNDYVYRPCKAIVTGRLWIECGDNVRIAVNSDESDNIRYVDTFVLSKELKGIQAMMDTYSADGPQIIANKSMINTDTT